MNTIKTRQTDLYFWAAKIPTIRKNPLRPTYFAARTSRCYMPDYFAILQQPRRPWLDSEALKEHFHRQTAERHPDVSGGGDGGDFASLNAAFAVLRDPASRVRHLLELEAPERLSPAQEIPPGLGDLFMRIAAFRHALDVFSKKEIAASSALARALLAGERLALSHEATPFAPTWKQPTNRRWKLSARLIPIGKKTLGRPMLPTAFPPCTINAPTFPNGAPSSPKPFSNSKRNVHSRPTHPGKTNPQFAISPNMVSSVIVGIDLGTTNSLIGAMDAGFPILFADADGERLTPSVVHFPETGEPLVGRPAARMRALEPKATVYSVKRFIGRRMGEEADDVCYTLAGAKGAPARIRVRDREFSPEEISALILGKLKADAERALGVEISRAVITVPAYFNDAQRQATKTAGELAGFTVERIVNEPTAAALAYGLDKLGDRSKIAVFDLGGGTFDISILELNQGVFQVLATNGNTRLGGDDIDAALIADCALPIPDWKKRDVIIQAKHRLSEEEAVEIALPFAAEGESLQYRLSRGELEKIAQPIVERTRRHCLRALEDSKLSVAELDHVILVGGQTRMPLVRRMVSEIFGRAPDVRQNPDEAVALGATIQAGILSGSVQNVVLLDVTPLSLGIETFGGLMNVIIPRNSTIPIKAGEMFTNAMAGQESMLITVLQGEREMAKDNWKLGEFDIPFDRAPKGQARVGVQFDIDANGILHVLARDTKTGTQKVVEMASAVDVSDEAVELMISESLEHAFEDVSERIFTEARLKSEELLPAVRRALESLRRCTVRRKSGARLPAQMAAVESAIVSGEAQRLKRANAALDEGTQRLATLLIEQAMAVRPQKNKGRAGNTEKPHSIARISALNGAPQYAISLSVLTELAEAAAHEQLLAGKPRGVVGSEEYRDRGNVVPVGRFGRAGFERRCPFSKVRADEAGALGAFRLDHAGVQRIDADLSRPELAREHSRDGIDRALRAGVD